MTNEEPERFFTPPGSTPLDLDVATLRAYGTVPTQFDGELHDGRFMYGRYRSGWLSVHLLKRQSDPLDDGICLMDRRVGPPLHGAMSLGQFCRLTRITVDGRLPPLPSRKEMHEERHEDLSGRTSFYFVAVDCTEASARSFVDCILRELKPLTLAEVVVDLCTMTAGYHACTSASAVNSMGLEFLLGEEIDASRLGNLHGNVALRSTFPESAVVKISYAPFKFPKNGNASNFPAEVSKVIGKPVRIAFYDQGCRPDTLILRAAFPAGSAKHRSRIEAFDSLFSSRFPLAHALCYDLETNARVPDQDWYRRYDPAVTAWTNAGDDRWLHIRAERKGDTRCHLGWRFR